MDHWNTELADQHFVRRHSRGGREERPYNPYIRIRAFKLALVLSLLVNGVLLLLLLR